MLAINLICQSPQIRLIRPHIKLIRTQIRPIRPTIRLIKPPIRPIRPRVRLIRLPIRLKKNCPKKIAGKKLPKKSY